MTEFITVLCCIETSSADCVSEYCRSWSDYLSDEKFCKSRGAVDWSTTMALSWIPFAGFNSLYRLGIHFDTIFEVVHSIFAIISILTFIEVDKNKYCNCDCFCGCVIAGFLLLDLVKILVDFNNATPAEIVFEIIFVILSFSVTMCCGANINDKRMSCVASALGLTLSMGILEWGKHIVKLMLDDELDINGCPLV